MIPSLETLLAAGYFSPLEVHFARAMGRLAEDENPLVLLGAAAASRFTGAGHVCVELGRLGGSPIVTDEGEPVADASWPAAAAWQEALAGSRMTGDGAESAPLVLDGGGRLYLTRYWRYQQRLAEQLMDRAGRVITEIDWAILPEGLGRFFPLAGPGGVPDRFGRVSDGADARETGLSMAEFEAGVIRQRLAAVSAMARGLTVISGGPGTGKTATVVRVLALLVEQALAAGRPAPRIRLAAPTGKAAARLTEALQKFQTEYVAAPDVRSDQVMAALPEAASTIHSLLRPRPDRPASFRFDAENPLPADVLVVDEASMVDLALMTRLVEAVPAPARLILLGDKDQLVSVEAGAILGDICHPAADALAGEWGRLLERLLTRAETVIPTLYARPAGPGRDRNSPAPYARPAGPGRDWNSPALRAAPTAVAPGRSDEPGGRGMADCIIPLTHSFRFGPRSGIGRLVRAIRRGDWETVRDCLDDPDLPDVRLEEMPDARRLPELLTPAVRERFVPCLRAIEPRDRLRMMGGFRILCAHRQGVAGVVEVNRLVEQLLVRQGVLPGTSAWYDGRPVLITRNDYRLNLFNGDVGVIGPAEPGSSDLRAFFPEAGERLRALPPGRLPPHETVYAMTVHKSQGSEFDDVLIILPERRSPVVTRELLYTAVSRARRTVTLLATREVVAAATAIPVQRASGLRERLWGADQ